MKKRDKTMLAAGIAIVIIALIAYQHLHQTATQSSQATSTTSKTSPSTTAKPAVKKLSYTEAVNKYAYRFQFSQCSGNPGLLSVQKGSPVMLDNRDAKAHTIKADGQSFYIAAYDYAVLYPQKITGDKLTSPNVTCDGGGSATLNVE